MLSDPIADFLTRIRNANMAGHTQVKTPYTKQLERIVEVLIARGFVESYAIEKGSPRNTIVLDIPKKKLHIERVSKPGLRIIHKGEEVKKIRSGYGVAIYSTSKGVISDEQARKAGIGGEIICQVW